MAEIGVGIVGLSATRGWGARAHFPALSTVPGYEVRALCASSPASAAASAAAYGIEAACADHRQLVARPEVDLVVVTVKVPEHRQIVTDAIGAGKAVLCEWPLGNGLEETRELQRLAADAKVPAFVGLQAVSVPEVRLVRRLVAAGEIGEVLSTTVVGSGDRWGASVPPEVAYLVDADNGATMLTVPVGHLLAGLASCLGEFDELSATTATMRPEVEVEGEERRIPMTAADQISISGRLVSGAIATVHYRGGRSSGTNLRWEIDGTDGTIVVRGKSGHLQYGDVDVEIARAGDAALEPVEVSGDLCLDGLEAGTPAYGVGHAYAALRDDLTNGTSRAPTFTDALRRHEQLATVEVAAAEGRRLRCA
jgi:predicted dehydrogenase